MTSTLFGTYLPNMEDVDAAKFRGVFMNNFPTVEDLTKTNIYLLKTVLWFCGWSSCCGNCEEKHRKVFLYSEVAAFHEPLLICPQ